MRSPLRFIVLAALALVAFVLPSLVEVVTNWWWFDELGYQATYATVLGAQATLGGLAFAVSLAWLTAHLRWPPARCPSSRRSSRRRRASRWRCRRGARCRCSARSWPPAPRCSPRSTPPRRGRTSSAGATASPFGTTDPILGHDVAFYVFTLPMLELAALVLARAGRRGGGRRRRAVSARRADGGHAVRRAARRTRPPAPRACSAPRSSCCSRPGAWLDRPQHAADADRHHPRRRLHRRPRAHAVRARRSRRGAGRRRAGGGLRDRRPSGCWPPAPSASTP